MDKIKVEPHVPSVYPLLPLSILQLDASRFQAVEATEWWTLYYIEAGCAEIGYAQRSHCLTQSQGILLRPGQAHNLLTFRDSSATVIQLDMHIDDAVAPLLCEQRLLFDMKCRKLLREIVNEAEMYCREAERKAADPTAPEDVYASGRYVQLLCEQLLIQLKRNQDIQLKQAETVQDSPDMPTPWEQNLRQSRRYTGVGRNNQPDTRKAVSASQSESANLQLYNKLVKYLEERVYESISLDELVNEFHFSKTHLSHTFKAHSGQTILTYYNNLKIEEAKRLILNTDMNFSQISNQLSFSSLHYFSRLFKKHTSMSPSEYQNSVIE